MKKNTEVSLCSDFTYVKVTLHSWMKTEQNVLKMKTVKVYEQWINWGGCNFLHYFYNQ